MACRGESSLNSDVVNNDRVPTLAGQPRGRKSSLARQIDESATILSITAVAGWRLGITHFYAQSL